MDIQKTVTSDWFLQGITTEVAGWIITGLLTFIISCLVYLFRKQVLNRVAHARPSITRSTAIPMLLLFFALDGFLVYWKRFFALPTLVILSLVCVLLWRELNKFWHIGLLRADLRTSEGVNYTYALKLCKNELLFLGIGASKLTADSEFEQAINRCHRHGESTLRFLLVRPTSSMLVAAEKRAGKREGDFSKKVNQSLRKLADLRRERGLNVEIRFYDGDPMFRLMFIDDTFCLFSYYIYGEGDGSQLPQLVIERSLERRDVESFYYPLRQYFQQLWDKSEEWDGETLGQDNSDSHLTNPKEAR